MSPRWFALHLEQVQTRLDDDPALSFDADVVDIDLSLGLKPRAVTFRGGLLRASGTLEALKSRLQTHGPMQGDSESSSAMVLRVQGATLEWNELDASGTQISARGFGLERSQQQVQIDALHIDIATLAGAVSLHAGLENCATLRD